MPACRRIAASYPAGYLELNGSFLKTHGEELLNLVCNEEKAERAEHLLESIMDITEKDEGALITTTGIHIARRIGNALSQAHKVDLSCTYGDGEKTIRILWDRPRA